jgi:ubiquinone/menaquinone biosynthesis C-methylase UbiE
MKTGITNRIRAVLDALPSWLRDARWFMAPMFAVWFKGRNVRLAMDFKRIGPALSDAQFRDVYARVQTLADARETDTNAEAMRYAIAAIDADAKSLVDVGSGRGYFLRELRKSRTFDAMFGCDLSIGADVVAMAEKLPFADRSIDVVTCFHTLEHSRDLSRAVAELRRITRKQLIVIVPRQKRFELTFDLHLQFFPSAAELEKAMQLRGEIRQFGDDLVYISRSV